MENDKAVDIKNLILVIDDSRDTLLLIKKTLMNKGFQVITTTSVTEALQIFNDHMEIRLILIDINLEAEISGIALAKKFNDLKSNRDFSMSFVSASKVDQSFIDAAHKIGVDGFISKPINLEQLQNKVESLLGISTDELMNMPKIKCLLHADLIHVNIIPAIMLIQITHNSFLLMSSADFVVGTILNFHCPALLNILTERYFTIKVVRSKRPKRNANKEMPFIVRCQIIEMNHQVRLSLESLFIKNATLPLEFELMSEEISTD